MKTLYCHQINLLVIKRNRAYRLSKHLQQIVPIEIVVKIYLGRASCFSKISDYRRSIEDAEFSFEFGSFVRTSLRSKR